MECFLIGKYYTGKTSGFIQFEDEANAENKYGILRSLPKVSTAVDQSGLTTGSNTNWRL